MNKYRLIGIIFLLAAVLIQYNLRGDFYNFLTGLLIALGIMMTISGRFGRKI